MKNRRNFYRILHVQPEAPLEIIKASYRSLMSKLKAHPDLGGDHEAAVLINQAYAVLSHPEKRRQYDESLRSTSARAPAARPAPAAAAARPRRAESYSEPGKQPRQAPVFTHCPFCRTEIGSTRRPGARCGACASPLELALPMPGARMQELFGRRAAPRIRKAADFRIYPEWPHQGHPAQLRDVSPTGISLLCEYAAQRAQILKLEGSLLTAIAKVVSVRTGARGGVSIHAAFLTAELLTRAGGFVSVKV